MFLRIENSTLVIKPNKYVHRVVYIPISNFFYNGGLNYEGMPDEYKDKPMTVDFLNSGLDWEAINDLLGCDAFYQERKHRQDGNLNLQVSSKVFPSVHESPFCYKDKYCDVSMITVIEHKTIFGED